MKISVLVFFIALFAASTYDSAAQVPSVIRVEIDWMANSSHSHKPSVAEMEAVKQMFACHGITFIYVISDSLQHFNVLRRDPADSTRFFEYNNGMDTYGGIKAAKFNNNGGGWHYCIFGHQYQGSGYDTSGSSGLGDTPGDDFVVTLGGFNPVTGTPWQRAATFAHELGHNLGLDHAGNMDPNVVGPNTPTVPSIMTYFFQLAGVKANLECQGIVSPGVHLFKNLDYSNGRGCTVTENALYEPAGMGMKAVDWNCNGTIDGFVSQDISNGSNNAGWCGALGGLQTLSDYDEWSNIRDVTASNQPYTSKNVSCITAKEYETHKNLFGACPEPVLANEPCINNSMYYVTTGNPGIFGGSCTQPYASIRIAYNVATNGDVIYLLPGNHSIGTGPFVLSKRLMIGGASGAVLGP